MRLKLTSKLIKLSPRFLQLFLKRLGLQKIINLIINKSEGELIFQSNWVGKFRNNKGKVFEYWQEYRCLDRIKEICRFGEATKVLDVGCGISTVLHFVEGEKYGLDPLADEYRKLYHYPEGIVVKRGVGEKIPFPKDFFDVVFCSNALDHADNPSKVVAEVARVLKSGGYFILTVHVFGQSFRRDPAHPHTFSKNKVYSLIRDNFQVILEEESAAVGDYLYTVEDKRISDKKELILVLKK